MATTFDGETIQSDSFTVTNGEAAVLSGGLESEIYEYSIPRSNGVGEKTSGHRRRVHRVRIRWCTTNESQVRELIYGFQYDRTVGTLVVESATSSTLTAPYCRLVDVQWGPRAAGYRPNGVKVTIMEAVLTFKQVRV